MKNNLHAPSEQINYQFKLLYAIGIWIILAGHCEGGGISLFYDWFHPYAFHLGLFVFSSGYFYKEIYEKNVLKYVIKKIKKLIIPLYLWNFFYAIVVTIGAYKGFTIGAGVDFDKLFIAPITHGHQFLFNLAGWFVVPLFMIEIYNILLRKALHFLNETTLDYLMLFTGILIGFIGISISNKGYTQGGWLILIRMMNFLPFYVCGYFYKKYLEKKDTLNNLIYFGSIMALNLILSLYHGGIYSFTQAWGDYSNTSPAIVYILGFSAIAFWLRVSKILTPILGRNKWINLIANNSYAIMIHHFLGFMLVKTLFACLYKFTIYCQDFNWNAYQSDLWYYYLPKGVKQCLIIYMFAGILIPIVIQAASNVLNKFLKKSLKQITKSIQKQTR